MRFVPPMRQAALQPAARGLIACCAALWLAGSLALAGNAPDAAKARKSDRLAVTAEKGDLLIRKPDRAVPVPVPVPSGAVTERGFAGGKAPARKLIDVSVREDGLWLNSFATRSMPLDAQACAEISEEIVSRLALPVGAVERLADEELMQQTRLCAVNGSLLVTCYGGTATVSLRHPALGDGCDH